MWVKFRMDAGASIAKEIVRRIDELFAIERDISGKPPTNGEPRTRNGRSRWFSRLRLSGAILA